MGCFFGRKCEKPKLTTLGLGRREREAGGGGRKWKEQERKDGEEEENEKEGGHLLEECWEWNAE